MASPCARRRSDVSRAMAAASRPGPRVVDGRVVVVGLDVLGMVGVAVPALPVVLPDELPVGLDDVVADGGHLGAVQPLGPQHRAERLGGRLEGRRLAGQADEDESPHLAEVDGVQAEVAPIEVAVPVHAAAGHQAPVPRVAPLVIRADQQPDLAGLLAAQTHPPVPAGVVMGVEPAVVAADHDHGVLVHVEREVLARLPHLAGVAGEEPAAAPDARQVELVDAGVGRELALEGVARPVLSDQAVEERFGLGESGRGELAAHVRMRTPCGSYSTPAATSVTKR